MVKVGDVVLAIRSKLGDMSSEKRRYSDAEIIDAINSSLAHMSEALLCFRRTWLIPYQNNVNRYELPGDFLKLISVRYNDALVCDIESMEHREQDSYMTSGMSAALDGQTIHLFNMPQTDKTDVIKLYYNYYETVSDSRETLALPNTAKEPIIYYALGLMYENNISSKGIEKSNRYKQLYAIEMPKLASRMHHNVQSKNIRSRHVKV